MKSLLLLPLATLALAGGLCGQYDYYGANGYYANNNMWGANMGTGSQCTYVDKMTVDGVSLGVEWNWSGNKDSTKAYPYAGRELGPKKLIKDITAIPSHADWASVGNSLRANVAYDMFTSSSANHDPSSGEYEIMIWVGNEAKLWPVGSAGNVVTVANKQWTLWDGYFGGARVFTFVATSDLHVVDLDIKLFFNYLRDRKGFPVNNQYLTTLQFGIEPRWGGPATFQLNWFAANVY